MSSDFPTRRDFRWPSREESEVLQGHTPHNNSSCYEPDAPFNWPQFRPRVFRSHAAPLVLSGGALLLLRSYVNRPLLRRRPFPCELLIQKTPVFNLPL